MSGGEFIEKEALEEGIDALFDADTDSDSETSFDKDFIDNNTEIEEETPLAFHNESLQTIDSSQIEGLEIMLGVAGKRRAPSEPATPEKPCNPKQNICIEDRVSQTLSPKLGDMQISPPKCSQVSRRQLFSSPLKQANNGKGKGKCRAKGTGSRNLSKNKNGLPEEDKENQAPDTYPDSGYNGTVPTISTQSTSREAESDKDAEEPCCSQSLSQESPEILSRVELNDEAREILRQNMVILIRSKDQKMTQLGQFKKASGFSFLQLVRTFHSDKTQYNDWIVISPDCRIDYWNQYVCRSPEVCSYLYAAAGVHVMYLLFFKGKSRAGVRSFFQKGGMTEIERMHFIEPPNTRVMMNAVYWMKSAIHGKGPMPKWIQNYFDGDDKPKQDDKFDMATMVQWALDHKYFDLNTVVFKYSEEAERNDPNAKAWLSCTSMLRYAHDAAKMARAMKKGREQCMTLHEFLIEKMAEWQSRRGDFHNVLKLLSYQGVNPILFTHALKCLINRIPKRCCLAIVGPPNTGKSMFCLALMKFLEGAVLSYFCHKSHFWLSPLAECKIALLDDCTWPAWDYIDMNLRNALDGTCLTIDQKNRDPRMVECPPLLITSNYDYRTGTEYEGGGGGRTPYAYLLSRITCFSFPRKLTGKTNKPKIIVLPEDWADFFLRYRECLGLIAEDTSEEDVGQEEEGGD